MPNPPEFAAPARAYLRAVPDSYDRCLRSEPLPIDVPRARAQHASYAEALRAAGVEVALLEADEGCPDCCFVEDTALVLGAERALSTRPGAEGRRAEVGPVGAALQERLRVAPFGPGGTLDGGDVLRVGQTLFVGRSSRTDETGVARLRQVAAEVGLEVVALSVAGGLHLKSVVTLLAPGRLVALREGIALEPLRARGLECLEVDEPAGANVLALGPIVLVSAAAPATAELLAGQPGLEVRAVAVDEFHKGDGALTCLSLRVPPPGGWCV